MYLNLVIFSLTIIYLLCLYNKIEFFTSNNDSLSKCQIYNNLFKYCHNNKEIEVCQVIDKLLSSCNNKINQNTIDKLKDIIIQVSKENNENLKDSLYALQQSIIFTNNEQISNTNILKKLLNMLNNLNKDNKNIIISDNIKEIIASSLAIKKHIHSKTNSNIEEELNNITSDNKIKKISKLLITT